jgi:hypothetical protein
MLEITVGNVVGEIVGDGEHGGGVTYRLVDDHGLGVQFVTESSLRGYRIFWRAASFAVGRENPSLSIGLAVSATSWAVWRKAVIGQRTLA